MEQFKECEKLAAFKAELDRLIGLISDDARKFYDKENKSAGIRLRKGLKVIKNYVQSVSNETSPKKVAKK
jgi:hypothetical protein